MIPGRLLLLPSLLAEGTARTVLPAGVVDVARATRHFLAENAKSSRAFLKAIEHPVALQEIDIVEIGHAPEAARIDEWLRPLRDGLDVALVSEAGCPAVADPGATVVARAHELGFVVKPLVGPSSILLALMASGLEGQRFRFVGYLPQDEAGRAAAIERLEAASLAGETQMFIETPYRNDRVFDALLRLCSAGTRLTVAVELTGQLEFVQTHPIGRWRESPAEKRPLLRHRPAVFALLATSRRPVRKR
jgi:16S rRNA (cytidine1402-2'-O)-methyltransferase